MIADAGTEPPLAGAAPSFLSQPDPAAKIPVTAATSTRLFHFIIALHTVFPNKTR